MALTSDQSEGLVFCTGALIASARVLTAAHCVALAEDLEREGLDLWFVTGGDLYAGDLDDMARIERLQAHPDFDPVSLEHDLAVLDLAQDMDGDVLGLNDRTVGSSWEGRDLWHVGYGITSWTSADNGVKREIMLPVYTVDSVHVFHYEPSGGNLCLGDSGGPAIDPDNDTIVGVASFVWAYEGETLCDEGGSATARVDIDADWIELAADLGESGGSSGGEDGSDDGEATTGAAGQLPADDAGLSCASAPAPEGLLWALCGGLWGLIGRRGEKESCR
jgi:hypothetical protein